MEEQDSVQYSVAGHVIMVISMTVISLASVIGNAMVMAAVRANRSLRHRGNYLLVNLALADFLQGAISIPMRLVEIVAGTDYNLRVLCQASIFSSTLFGGNSNIVILFISIERFTAVTWPYFHHSRVTRNVLFGAIGMSWLGSVVFALLPVVGVGSIDSRNPINYCRFPMFLSSTYLVVLYVAIFFIPIAIVTPLYGVILRSSFNNLKKINAQELQAARFSATRSEVDLVTTGDSTHLKRTHAGKRAGRHRKSAKIVLRIVGTFIILNMPIFLIDIVDFVGGPSVPFALHQAAVIMASAHHCINVFIYTGYNGDFRRTFKSLLLGLRDALIGFVRPKSKVCHLTPRGETEAGDGLIRGGKSPAPGDSKPDQANPCKQNLAEQ